MPDHWQETTLGEVVYLQRRRIDPSKVSPDTELLHWSIPALDETGGPLHEAASAIGSHKFEVSKSCVLLSLLNPRIPRFAVAEGGEGVVCSTEFAALTPSEAVSLQFLACLVSAPSFFEPFLNLAQGTTKSRERVKPSDLLSIPLRVPSAPEQRRIVDLVGSIDTYIDSLETQIETTRTARSALLSELLSNPGDDWQETTLGKIADYLNGFPFKPEHLTGVSLPVIRIRQLVDSSEVPDRTDLEVAERHRIDDGDIVFSWSATLAVRIWNRGPALLNQHLFKVMPKEGVDGQWLSMALEHAIDDLANKSHGTTMKHITKKSLESHPTLVPPLDEQRRIVDLVGSIDEQISSLESQVETVRTLRSGVLSELLSGERLLDESYDLAVGI